MGRNEPEEFKKDLTLRKSTGKLYKKELEEKIILTDSKKIIKISTFGLGLLVGALGGVMGDFFVYYWIEWTKDLLDISKAVIAIIMLSFFSGFVAILWKFTFTKEGTTR